MKENYKKLCYTCGHELIWDNSFTRGDIGLEEDNSIVDLYSCPYCGASYEIYECPTEERDNYEYYKNEKL